MDKYFAVALGGAFGSALRFWFSTLDHRYAKGAFPVNTFIVNILGSLVIGLLWGISEKYEISAMVRLFLFVGILGGFTTFSSFSLETINLLKTGEYRIAFLYITLSNVIGLGMAFGGHYIAKVAIK